MKIFKNPKRKAKSESPCDSREVRKIKKYLFLIFGLLLIGGAMILLIRNKPTKFLEKSRIPALTKNDFTIVALPDTQKYSEKYPHIFDAQIQWIVDNKDVLNIVFVTHLGDIVHNGDDESQWQNALNSMKKLDGIVPYGVLPGNHDMNPKNSPDGTTTTYNKYFPVSKYEKRLWWGDNYPPESNKNNYQLFSVGSLDFIILHLEARPPDDVLRWAKKVLNNHPNRKAIISTHIYLNRWGRRTKTAHLNFFKKRKGGNSGKNIWKKVIKIYPNIFMVLSGHSRDEEKRKTPTNDWGKPVFEVMQNYQHRKNGGNGWLRYYVFKPSENKIYAYTYSPYLDKFETDKSSQFVLDYN